MPLQWATQSDGVEQRPSNVLRTNGKPGANSTVTKPFTNPRKGCCFGGLGPPVAAADAVSVVTATRAIAAATASRHRRFLPVVLLIVAPVSATATQSYAVGRVQSAIQPSVRLNGLELNDGNDEGPPERALVSIQASRGVGLSSRAGSCWVLIVGAAVVVLIGRRPRRRPRVAGEHGDQAHRAALADRAAERPLPEHLGERHRASGGGTRHRRPAVVVPVRVVVEVDDVEADLLVVVGQPDLPAPVLVQVVGHRLGEAVAADGVPDLRVPTAVVVQVEPRDLVVAVEVPVVRGAVPAPVAVELPVLPARSGRGDARRGQCGGGGDEGDESDDRGALHVFLPLLWATLRGRWEENRRGRSVNAQRPLSAARPRPPRRA